MNLIKRIFSRKRKLTIDQQIRKRTVISFILFFAFIGLGIGGWFWLYNQPGDNEIQAPLRAGLKTNERIFKGIFSPTHLAKTFPKSDAVKNVRVNGDAGMGNDFNPTAWQLHVVRKKGDTLLLNLSDIKALPKTEVVFDFKCIEGWSQVTHWGGVKFSDFIKKYGLTQQCELSYVGMSTPDKKYYVGVDVESMMQPQTILCYEMNGKPLPFDQGAPLRLIIPVKYGIKHIKRIGTLFFSNNPPPDYWAEKGYDYYSGL